MKEANRHAADWAELLSNVMRDDTIVVTVIFYSH